MFKHEKQLFHPVGLEKPNPQTPDSFIPSQFIKRRKSHKSTGGDTDTSSPSFLAGVLAVSNASSFSTV